MGGHISTPRQAWSGFEARIGRRVDAHGLVLDWRPATAKRSWRSRRSPVDAAAEVVDLSVSGARVAVADDEPLAAGVLVGIGLDGCAGMAAVRRVEAGSNGRSIYGIEFKDLDPALRERLGQLARADQGELASQWQRAR
ncbi:MAG: PilZ domain-containing protein [Acidimicrobiales bacterium]